MAIKAPRFKAKLEIIKKPFIHDFCILFSYHKNDPITHRHFDLFKSLNPHCPIVPIAFSNTSINGTFNVGHIRSPWIETNEWRACDVPLYKWFLNRTHTARRYILVEYDVLPEVSVNDYFSDVWNDDIGTPCYLDKKTHKGKWNWFGEIDRLPEQYRQFAAGIVPLATLFVKHDALASIVDKAVGMNDIFCELRMGTCAKASGIVPRIMQKSKSVRHHISLIKKLDCKTFYHPIKSDADMNRIFNK